MMYLKQFPDICREMGFDVEEKEKIVTLCVTDINCSININKKLFLEDLELTLDSYSEVCVAIAVFEAKAKAGKYDNLDATELQKLKRVFDKAWETGQLKDDTGMFQTEVDSCHQHAECLKAVLEKLLEKLKKEVDKARLYSTSSHNFPIVMKQIDACALEKSEIRGLNEVSIWEEKYHGKQYQPRGIQNVPRVRRSFVRRQYHS